ATPVEPLPLGDGGATGVAAVARGWVRALLVAGGVGFLGLTLVPGAPAIPWFSPRTASPEPHGGDTGQADRSSAGVAGDHGKGPLSGAPSAAGALPTLAARPPRVGDQVTYRRFLGGDNPTIREWWTVTHITGKEVTVSVESWLEINGQDWPTLVSN